jgi:butyrate kinase
MAHKILVINTGSSTTRVAIMQNNQCLAQEEKVHSTEELKAFTHLQEEATFRKELITHFLSQHPEESSSLSAIGAIGGILKPLPGGVYSINEALISDIQHGRTPAKHASNISALLAYDFAYQMKLPAYIVDPISTDELWEVSRITGFPAIERKSRTHALNVKACFRKLVSLHKQDPKGSYIIAHLGGGLSVNLVVNGRIVDIEDGRQYGPFSTEAAGGVPIPDLLQYMMEKELDPRSLLKYWYGKGGFVAHLGINSIKDTLTMAKDGDSKAQILLDAFIYQICKAIGALSIAAKGKIKAIVLTGGAARSDIIVEKITAYIATLAPLYIFPGENELEAIAESVELALDQKIPTLEYQ